MRSLYLFLAILVSFESLAQHPQLFDNTWHFTSGQLNGEPLELDWPHFQNELTFDATQIRINYPTCEEINTCDIDYGTSNSSFELIGLLFTFGGFCSFDFMVNHVAIYFNSDRTPKNPFNYTLEDQGSYLQLTVMNGNGDTAIYANQFLGVTEEELLNTSIFPNPANDIIWIKSTSSKVLSLIVYTIKGISIDSFTMGQNETEKINIAHLTSGIYFLKIVTDRGHITQKLIKQ